VAVISASARRAADNPSAATTGWTQSLAHSSGDAINGILAAIGYNFRPLVRWLAILCAKIEVAFCPPSHPNLAAICCLKWRSSPSRR